MVTKKFSKKLHEENDREARELAKEFFASIGYFLKDNPDEYGPDLVCTSYLFETKDLGYVECEIKYNWQSGVFPFETLQIPARKSKFLDKQIVFFVINAERSKAAVVLGKDVASSPTQVVSNKYVKDGEEFFQIPVDKVIFVDLN